jgi:hypothetical protein
MQRVPWTAHHVALLAAESEDDLEEDEGAQSVHNKIESYRISVVTSRDRSIRDPCDLSRVTITICREILSASGDYWSLGGRSPSLPSTILCCFQLSRVHVRGLAATKPSCHSISRHKHINQSHQLLVQSTDHDQSRFYRFAHHACRKTQAVGRRRRDSKWRCPPA